MIDEKILSQMLVIKELLDKQLEYYDSKEERKAFNDGVHHTINMVFKSK